MQASPLMPRRRAGYLSEFRPPRPLPTRRRPPRNREQERVPPAPALQRRPGRDEEE